MPQRPGNRASLLPGLFVLLVGLGIMVAGLGLALRELFQLYGGVLSAPLDQPEGVEMQTRNAMLKYALLGALGLPVALVGKMMLARAFARRMRTR